MIQNLNFNGIVLVFEMKMKHDSVNTEKKKYKYPVFICVSNDAKNIKSLDKDWINQILCDYLLKTENRYPFIYDEITEIIWPTKMHDFEQYYNYIKWVKKKCNLIAGCDVF